MKSSQRESHRRTGKVERIARAVAAVHSPAIRWESRSPEARALFTRMAKAAMREVRKVVST